MSKNISSPTRLHVMDKLRAFAISLVVLGHCLAGLKPNSALSVALFNLVIGGSAIFVFISGFFLHRVYFKRYNYRDFVKQKFIDIGIPYAILSSLCFFYSLISMGRFPKRPNKFIDSSSEINLFIFNLVTGASQWSYWFIPFILMVFMLTPLYLKFIHIPGCVQRALIIVLFLVSSFVWRPTNIVNVFQSIIYFSPYYLAGMYFSLNELQLRRMIVKFLYPSGCVLVFILLLMHVKSGYGNVSKSNPFEFVGIDLIVPKQFALIVFLLSIAYKYLDSSSRFLDRIADYTLPIFFLHGFVLFAVSKTEILHFFYTTIFHKLFLFVVVMTISMSVAKLVRVMLGNKSKFLIGK